MRDTASTLDARWDAALAALEVARSLVPLVESRAERLGYLERLAAIEQSLAD